MHRILRCKYLQGDYLYDQLSKLREMRLSVMANALKDQLADPQFQSMAFEDRLEEIRKLLLLLLKARL